jgi:hypothetical protein
LPVTIAAKTVTAANPHIKAVARLIKQTTIQKRRTICGLRAQPDLDQAADGFGAMGQFDRKHSTSCLPKVFHFKGLRQKGSDCLQRESPSPEGGGWMPRLPSRTHCPAFNRRFSSCLISVECVSEENSCAVAN